MAAGRAAAVTPAGARLARGGQVLSQLSAAGGAPSTGAVT
jgi:hypothetical protein